MKRKKTEMKVVLVGAYPPPFGGVQVHIEKLKQYLESRGHDCFVVNLGKNKAIRSSDIASPRNSLETALLLLKHRGAVCHLHYGGAIHLRLILLTLFVGLFFKGKCAATIHSGGLPVWGKPSSPLKQLMIRKSFDSLELIICVNKQIAGYFRDLNIGAGRIKVVSPFVFEMESCDERDLPPALRQFLEEKGTVICNIGLLEPEYDLEMLLRVFAAFRQEHPDSGLVMIGSGSLHERLDRKISESGLNGSVLLCGDLDHRHTLKVLASSTCYVRASKYDGDCISLREALHIGIPAIASDTGLRPEGVSLFQIGDEEALLDLLRRTVSRHQPKRSAVKPNPESLRKIETILYGLAAKVPEREASR